MTISILGISGSLRSGSYNTCLLRAAQELAPAGTSISIADIAGVPLYREEVYQAGFPPAVDVLREQIGAADAVLIATPEYNFSFSGVLKNAIDWVSRPPSQPFDGKLVALLGASPGRMGTVRAQSHLRQVLVFLNGRTLNKPEVLVNGASQAFDSDGRLIDEAARKAVVDLVQALAAAVSARSM